ncbi:hypothetical protein B5S30_g835 [[Candida] boidinii]|nr:hypothetical protein B5S30_g835 [[Candida] boidinii]GMG00274.1 unnamed protein product [[Candida] boidinii]
MAKLQDHYRDLKPQEVRFEDIQGEHNYSNKKFLTIVSYIIFLIGLLFQVGILVSDVYTLIQIYSLGNWDSTHAIAYVPILVYKLVFTICIGISFLWLIISLGIGIRIFKTDSIVKAYFDDMAKTFHSLRNYEKFCIFNSISTKNFFDWSALLTYQTFHYYFYIWLFADTPRQLLNGATIAYTVSNSFNSSNVIKIISDIAATDSTAAVLLSLMTFSFVLWVVFTFKNICCLIAIFSIVPKIKKREKMGFSEYCHKLVSDSVMEMYETKEKDRKIEMKSKVKLPSIAKDNSSAYNFSSTSAEDDFEDSYNNKLFGNNKSSSNLLSSSYNSFNKDKSSSVELTRELTDSTSMNPFDPIRPHENIYANSRYGYSNTNLSKNASESNINNNNNNNNNNAKSNINRNNDTVNSLVDEISANPFIPHNLQNIVADSDSASQNTDPFGDRQTEGSLPNNDLNTGNDYYKTINESYPNLIEYGYDETDSSIRKPMASYTIHSNRSLTNTSTDLLSQQSTQKTGSSSTLNSLVQSSQNKYISNKPSISSMKTYPNNIPSDRFNNIATPSISAKKSVSSLPNRVYGTETSSTSANTGYTNEIPMPTAREYDPANMSDPFAGKNKSVAPSKSLSNLQNLTQVSTDSNSRYNRRLPRSKTEGANQTDSLQYQRQYYNQKTDMVSKRSGTDQSTEQRAQYSQTANTSTESPFINSVSNTGKIKQHKTGESNKIKSKTVDSQLKPSDPTNLDEYDDIRHSGIYNSRGIGW